MRPPRTSQVAYSIQLAYNGLLRWALDLPLTTRLELLHALANLPPAWTLLAKQLLRYASGLSCTAGLVAPSTAPGTALAAAAEEPLPSHPRLASAVWHAIATKEVEGIVARPLDTAPAFWQRLVADRGGLEHTSIAALYSEARALLRAGFQESSTLLRAGTTTIWEAMLPYLYRTKEEVLSTPPGWTCTTPDLACTQLYRSPLVPSVDSPPLLHCRATPNWLSCNSHAHLHALLATLAPPAHRLAEQSCPWCHGAPSSWDHALHHCEQFLSQLPPHLVPWAALVRTKGIGFALVAASTRVLLLLTLTARSLLECAAPLPDAHSQPDATSSPSTC